jgi:hypothetical protein
MTNVSLTSSSSSGFLYADFQNLVSGLQLGAYEIGLLAASGPTLRNVKQASFGIVANGTVSGTKTIDWTSGLFQSVTLGANTTFTFVAPTGCSSLTLWMTQSGTGSMVPTFPTTSWAGSATPTWSQSGGRTDVVSLIYDTSKYWGAASIGHV